MTIKDKEIKPPEVDLFGEVDLELKESMLAAKELKKIEFNEQQKKISRGVHKYSVQQKQEKNHREAK